MNSQTSLVLSEYSTSSFSSSYVFCEAAGRRGCQALLATTQHRYAYDAPSVTAARLPQRRKGLRPLTSVCGLRVRRG